MGAAAIEPCWEPPATAASLNTLAALQQLRMSGAMWWKAAERAFRAQLGVAAAGGGRPPPPLAAAAWHVLPGGRRRSCGTWFAFASLEVEVTGGVCCWTAREGGLREPAAAWTREGRGLPPPPTGTAHPSQLSPDLLAHPLYHLLSRLHRLGGESCLVPAFHQWMLHPLVGAGGVTRWPVSDSQVGDVCLHWHSCASDQVSRELVSVQVRGSA